MTTGLDPAVVTAALDGALTAASDPKVKTHWDGYLKGTATFRGVPMAGTRAAVRAVWRDHHLADATTDELLALAHRWFAAPTAEDQLAAVLLLTEHVRPRLDLAHVDALAVPLTAGHVHDWNVCDWYAVKALHGFVADGPDVEARARAIAAWARADGLWQRRAGVVAFVNLAKQGDDVFAGFVDLVLDACAANLVSDDRFAHTGPGWALRELSTAAPEAVAAFVDAHPELSTEARRMATARLRPGPYRRR